MSGSSLRSFRASVIATLALGAALVSARPASAFSPYLVVPDPYEAEASPAYRYANMTNEEALAELERRKIPFVQAEQVSGVRAPVRLTGRLHGVYIHSALPAEQRETTIYEILDARLALALDDFTAVLEKHDIDEIVHYSLYRPNVPREPEKAPEMTGHVPNKAANAALANTTKPAPEPPEKAEKAPKETKPAKAAPKKTIPAKPVAKATTPTKATSTKGTKPTTTPMKAAPTNATPTKPIHAASPSALPAARPVELGKTAPVSKGVAAPLAKGGKHKEPAALPPKETKVVHAPPAKSAMVKPAAHAPRKWAPPGTRHPAGLAIDVAKLHKKDGTWISVLDHFHGKLGEKTCGDGAVEPEEGTARELRALVCESERQSIFTYVLTPNYDPAHADHFHMEIKPGVSWFLVH